MSADTAVVMVILIIVVIVLFVKLSGLRGELASRANSEALTMLERWKAIELRKQVAREVELSIASIREKAENDVKLAKQEARFEFQKWKADETLRIRQDASARSSAVHVGKVTEHLIPWFLDGAFDPRDIRFVGSPIDLIVFHGLSAGYVEAIHFIEVKSGKRPILAPREELVRGAVVAGRIAYSIVHLAPDGDSGGASLNWLGEKPMPQTSRIMNEEIKMLLERKSEATSALEFEASAELEKLIFENFGRSIANLADEVAILREEVRSGNIREKKPRKGS
jgi:predicted Holliday junction resolvase-like endonuclease